jgi:hypothetical protein
MFDAKFLESMKKAYKWSGVKLAEVLAVQRTYLSRLKGSKGCLSSSAINKSSENLGCSAALFGLAYLSVPEELTEEEEEVFRSIRMLARDKLMQVIDGVEVPQRIEGEDYFD